MKNLRIAIPLLLAALLLPGCVSKYFYHPTSRVYQTPTQHQLKYEKVVFQSKDGTNLTGWFVPACGKPIGTVIHFHGNAQNMTAHFSYVSWLPEEGFNLFVFDYRGYGQSEGRPGRRGVYEDGVAAIEYVVARPDIDPERVVILGQSLGGANALAVIGKNSFSGIRAVAIDSAFYSYRAIVQDKLKQIPVLSWLRWPLSFLIIRNSFSAGSVVDRVAPVPIVFIHGAADRTIPAEHSRRLYKQAREPKELWVIENARHTEAFTRHGHKYRTRLVEFFKQSLKAPSRK